MEPSRDPSVVAARGFTLVELIVVLFLIIILTTITITSQTNYNRSLIITNTAYTVALSIRESQSLGLSSRNFGGVQNAGYGINFNKSDQQKYRIFADVQGTPTYSPCPTGGSGTPEAKPGNCLYDGTTEILKTYSLNKGFRVNDFCAIRTSGGRICASDATNSWSSMNITFIRPNTEAVMSMVGSAGTVPLNCAVIWIAPPNGTVANMKCIVVSQVGQVSVPQTCPAASFTVCP